MIKAGDRLPDATFRVIKGDGPVPLHSADIFKGKRVVLVGMPGAFTATCSRNHLPGFLAKADAIRAKGIDSIAVTAVNDHWVMNAWAKVSNAGDKILFLADGNGEFVKAIGLDYDATERGMGGIRSKRYAMLVEDGVVKVIHVETETGKAEATSADNLMKAL
jgi:peroxiredoxin